MAGNRYKPVEILADDDFDPPQFGPFGVDGLGLLVAQNANVFTLATTGDFQGSLAIYNSGGIGLSMEYWLIQDPNLLYNGMRYRSVFGFETFNRTNADHADEIIEIKCGDMILKFHTGTSQAGVITTTLTPASNPAAAVNIPIPLDRGLLQVDMAYAKQGNQMECTVSQDKNKKKVKITGYTAPDTTVRAFDEIYWKISTTNSATPTMIVMNATIETVQVGQNV